MHHYFHILTLIFVSCKIAEIGAVASWSWWLVLAPSLFSIAVGLIVLIVAMIVVAANSR